LSISPPYPNPFTGSGPVWFNVSGPSGSKVAWDVFTTAFRKIAGGSQPVNGVTPVDWYLQGQGTELVANGLYYIRVKVTSVNSSTTKILKVLVIR
jgi:hypothetical protein